MNLLSSAPCGNWAAHGPHAYPLPYMDQECPGLPVDAAAVRALIILVREYVSEHTPPRGGGLPEGIRLEMHPSVRQMILRNVVPDFIRSVAKEPMPFSAEVPVVITPLLPRGAWRLVVVTEDVIDGGVMPS